MPRFNVGGRSIVMALTRPITSPPATSDMVPEPGNHSPSSPALQNADEFLDYLSFPFGIGHHKPSPKPVACMPL